jgi:FkbM family methyltransferase
MNLRPDTYDQFIHDEIYIDQVYSQMSLNKDDVVLDIGANIWAYTVHASETARQVIAFEPEAGNYVQLLKNIKGKRNIICYNSAVGYMSWVAQLHLSNTKNNWLHTLYPAEWSDWQSKQVWVMALDEIIDQYWITKIKCDCEGWEYDIFDDYRIPSSVKEIVWECHLLNRDREKAEELMFKLGEQFTTCNFTIWDLPTFNFYFKR